MDKINDYIKNIHLKNALVGGFDKEAVFLMLKELVALFEEVLNNNVFDSKEDDHKLDEIHRLELELELVKNELGNKEAELKAVKQKYSEAFVNLKQKHQEFKQKQIVHNNASEFNHSLINNALVKENEELRKRLLDAKFEDSHEDIIINLRDLRD